MICYYARFAQDANGAYNVSFPDLPGCATFGKDMESALKQAMDALAGYIEVEMDLAADLPQASDHVRAKEKAEAEKLDLPAAREVIYQLVCAEPKIVAPESITIWMQRGLFRKVKAFAKQKGISISHLLELAARDYLQREARKSASGKN